MAVTFFDFQDQFLIEIFKIKLIPLEKTGSIRQFVLFRCEIFQLSKPEVNHMFRDVYFFAVQNGFCVTLNKRNEVNFEKIKKQAAKNLLIA